MIHTQDLEKVFALSIASGYVQGEKPVSAMVVSERPESGKTEQANRFRGKSGIAVVSDLTAFGFWRDFGGAMTSGDLKHIIIPEFLAPLSRGSDTVNSFIAMLQMLIEEGLTELHTGFLAPIKFESPIVVGAIVCMPRNAFQLHKAEWEVSGFLSRFLVVTYKYDDESVESIFRSIVAREYLKHEGVDLNFSGYKPIPITVPVPVAEACRVLAESITEQARKDGKCYGFRELKNILRLVAANVVLDRVMTGAKRTKATMSDFEDVMAVSYLINDQFNAVSRPKEVGNS